MDDPPASPCMSAAASLGAVAIMNLVWESGRASHPCTCNFAYAASVSFVASLSGDGHRNSP